MSRNYTPVNPLEEQESIFLAMASPLGMQKPKLMTALDEPKKEAPKKSMVAVPDLDGYKNAYMQQQSGSQSFQAPQADQEYVEKFKQYLGAREAGAADMEKAIAEAAERDFSGAQHMDLSPLMAYLDSTTGSKLSQGYKAPTAQAEHQKRLMEMQKQLGDEKRAITDDQLKYLGFQGSMANSRAAIEAGRDRRFDDNQLLQMENNIRKDIDKANENFEADARDTQNLMNILDRPNVPIEEVKIILSQFARRIGGEKGALSDGDVARAMPNTGINTIEGLKTYIGMKGMLDPVVQNAMRKLAQIARENTALYHQKRLANKRRMYDAGGQYSPLMQPGALGDNIFKTAEESVQAQLEAVAPKTGGAGFQEWLKKKKGEQ